MKTKTLDDLFYDGLKDIYYTERKILKDAAVEARSYQRQVARDQAASAQKAMAAKGLAVNDVSPAEYARMREQVQPVWQMFKPDVGDALYQQVMQELAAK